MVQPIGTAKAFGKKAGSRALLSLTFPEGQEPQHIGSTRETDVLIIARKRKEIKTFVEAAAVEAVVRTTWQRAFKLQPAIF